MDLSFFTNLQNSLEEETDRKDKIRMAVKELERSVRSLNATLNQIQADPTGPVPSVDFSQTKQSLKALANLIPQHEFYKYNDLWARTTQQIVFLLIYRAYLEQGEITNIIPTVESTLDVKVDIHNNLVEFHIPLEDILHGYISLFSELSRLCVNSVTAGDYERPLVISKHLKDLSAAFQILNLKNDSLRKRFDGIKYEVKKTEEVVYDISLRGLQNTKKRTADKEADTAIKNRKTTA